MAPSVLQRPDSSVVLKQTPSLASVTENYCSSLRFYLNGTRVELENADPEATLLEYLRGVGLTGTKLGCAEGGCGACTVVCEVDASVLLFLYGHRSILTVFAFQVISHLNPTTKQIYHASVNACLAPLVSVDGKHVITVEGIGNANSLHAVQQRIAAGNGSQCGFCTPGIVMVSFCSLFLVGKTQLRMTLYFALLFDLSHWLNQFTSGLLEFICPAAEQSFSVKTCNRRNIRWQPLSLHRLPLHPRRRPVIFLWKNKCQRGTGLLHGMETGRLL